MRHPATVVLVVALALAGCADDAPSAPTSTDDRPAPSGDGSTESVAGAETGDGPDDEAGAGTSPEPVGPGVDEPLGPNAVVDRIVDGDTIIVEIAGTRERVRLIGIDTPESVAENRPEQCFGQESSDYLAALIPPGTEVTLVRDVEARDQFDRLLAYVVRSADGLFVNLDLVEKGFAGPFTIAPNDAYADAFEAAAVEAAGSGVGLWGACGGPDEPLT